MSGFALAGSLRDGNAIFFSPGAIFVGVNNSVLHETSRRSENRVNDATGSPVIQKPTPLSCAKVCETPRRSLILFTHRPWTPFGRESRRCDGPRHHTRTHTLDAPRSRPCSRHGDGARVPALGADNCARRSDGPARRAAPSPRIPGPAPARGSACTSWPPRHDDHGERRRLAVSRRRLID